VKTKVWFHRSRALFWLVAGLLSFPLGWANAVWFVTVASIYANIESGWATSEAADDSAVLAALEDIKERLDRIEEASHG